MRVATERSMIRIFSAAFLVLSAATHVHAQDGFCMVNGATTGGAGGPTVTVTNGTDFNTQINIAGPRIIQVQGPITIGRINTAANKTIIGLGTDAMLYGNLNISDSTGATNVIVRNLRISNPGGDGLTIWNTHHVWIDHCTFIDCSDGSCDMNRGSQYVTVSWCKFVYPTQLEHRFTMIADGYDNGSTTNWGYYTLHHNWWSTRANQRMPASSFGRIHMYNNYFSCTNNGYSSNARCETEFLSENNYYSGVNSPIYKECTGRIKTVGNIYAGTTGNTPDAGTDMVFTPSYAYTLDSTVDVPGLVMSSAGASGPDIVVVPPKVWDGGGGNDNLNTANNWGFNETPKEYDTLLFAGNTRLTPNNSTANNEYVALSFSNNAGAFVLGGSALNLGEGITDDSAALQTINLNISFAYGIDHYTSNRYINVSSPSGSLVLNGQLTGPTNTYGRVYSITKLGPGLFTLAGGNTLAANYKLNGGLLRFSTLATELPGSLGLGSRLDFDGGGLQWSPGNTADISARTVTLQPGGGRFDVGANNVTFANPIGNNGTGGLTKAGSGALTLNGNNNYSGTTRIEQGVLALGLSCALPNSPQIVLSNNAILDVSGRTDGKLTLGSGKSLRGVGTVLGSVTAASGSTLTPGFSVGTLAFTNELLFQAGSTNIMELDAATHTNDLVTGMASVSYGGRLVLMNLGGAFAAGDSFKLFGAGSYNGTFASIVWPSLTGTLVWSNKLAVDGTIAVVDPVNTTPSDITWAVIAGQLQLSWPSDHTGWRLEIQTNAIDVGLNTNWLSLGYQSTNTVSLPLDPENGSVFYRLAYP
jgi:autotransporter-associated beta strand protein